MEDNDLVMFDAPIPGSSLTTELGSEPHERPAEIADPADAYEFIASGIIGEEAFERVAVAAEIGVPVELIARSIVFSACSDLDEGQGAPAMRSEALASVQVC